MPPSCIETLSASLSRQLMVDYDYVWPISSGTVRGDLRQVTLVSLPIPTRGAGKPIGILTRINVQPSQAAQILIIAVHKTVSF